MARQTDQSVCWYIRDIKNTRTSILEHAKLITIELGEVPSLNAVAKAAGVSKGGLIHHFPSRQALLEALVKQAIDEVDLALDVAVEQGTLLRTWLDLSVPHPSESALFRSLATTFFAVSSHQASITNLVADANRRWESALEGDLGSADLARVARLLADGLLLGAIGGTITEQNADEHVTAAHSALIVLRADTQP